jgi:hypothetical protein
VKSRAGSDHGSPQRGSGRPNSLVEAEEGTGASISPKVASAMVAGAGAARRRRRRSGSPASPRERERERRVGMGWVGLTDPDPSQLV